MVDVAAILHEMKMKSFKLTRCKRLSHGSQQQCLQHKPHLEDEALIGQPPASGRAWPGSRNCSDCSVSSLCCTALATAMTSDVLALPPRDSCTQAGHVCLVPGGVPEPSELQWCY